MPSLGIAFHLLPRVLAVVPGGPADRAGIKPNDVLEELVLTRKAGAAAEPFRDGSQASIAIDLDGVAEGKPLQNFAYAFAAMQRYPLRDVTLASAAARRRGRSPSFPGTTRTTLGSSPTRGFLPMPLFGTLQAESVGDALRLGYEQHPRLGRGAVPHAPQPRDGGAVGEGAAGPAGIFGIACRSSRRSSSRSC